MASTALDALIADLLGDVGKLHDDVKGLEGLIPAQAQAMEEHMAPLVGSMNTAAERLVERCKELTTTASKVAKEAHEQRAREVATHYVSAIGKEAQRVAAESVAGPIKSAVGNVNQAAQAVASSARIFRGNLVELISLVIVGGAVAGIFGGFGMGLASQHFASPQITKRQQQDMAIGHRIRAAWPELSRSTKAEVQRALTNQH